MVLGRVALTGASGMMGRHLLAILKERGITCRATSRTKPKHMPTESTWTPLDLQTLTSVQQLDQLLDGTDAIIHAGALLPANDVPLSHFLDVNVRGTLILGQWAAQKNIPFVFISSATVYKNISADNIPEDAPLTTGDNIGGFYGLSKMQAEQTIMHLASNHNLQATILRPSSLYGTGLPSHKLLPAWLIKAHRGGTIQISPPADQYINWIHAHDLARAILLALKMKTTGIFNVSGFGHTLRELAECCIQVTGNGRIVVEENVDIISGKVFDLDGSAAKATLHFNPQVSLKEGLRSMLLSGEYL